MSLVSGVESMCHWYLVQRVCVIGIGVESMCHWYLYREYVSLVSV